MCGVLSEQTSLPLEGLAISDLAMPNQVSFRYFKTSSEIIQLAVMLYVRFPLSLRNVEDLLHERGVDVSYESVRYWWHRFCSQFASQIKKRRAGGVQSSHWKWHLDEVFVRHCQNKPPCLTASWKLTSATCPILYPFATSKPVQRSSSLR